MSSIIAGLTGLYDILTESVKILVALSTPTTPITTSPITTSQIRLPDIEMEASVCADDRRMIYYDVKTGDVTHSFEYILV